MVFKFGLQSILNLISFLELVFYICAVPVFKFESSLIDNSKLDLSSLAFV